MWSHYAKDHTGCVLGLRCRPDLDRPLCAVKPVEYLREFPLRATLPEYIKHLTGQVEIDEEKVFQRFAFAKGADWHYEQEWRGMSELRDRVNGSLAVACAIEARVPEHKDCSGTTISATLCARFENVP